MRFRGLHIDGFGIHHDTALRDLDEGLTVLLGQNEAGKSTCLAFFRHLLFGFPDGRSKESPYAPLRGGTHGGRLFLTDSVFGNAITVERRPGPRGGSVRVVVDGQPAGGEALLNQVLGGGTRPLFCNVYAFSLQELQTIQTLQDDAVRGAIYAASVGAGARSLPSAQKALADAMGDIFKPGGSKQLFTKHLKTLEQLRKNLQTATAEISHYDALCAERDGLGDAIDEQRARLRRLEAELRHWQQLADLWDDWTELLLVEKQLQNLPQETQDFPENGLARFEKALERRALASTKLRELHVSQAALNAELDKLQVDVALLDVAARVRSLEQGVGAFRETLAAVPGLRAELETREAALRDGFSSLGPDWNEKRVTELDRSLFTRDTIRAFRTRLAETVAEAKEAERDLQQAESGYEQAEQETTTAAGELAKLTSCEPRGEFPDSIDTIRARRDLYRRAIAEQQRCTDEAQRLARRIATAAAEIDPAWTPQDVAAADTSMATRQSIEAAAAAIATASRSVEQAEAVLEAATFHVRSATEKVEHAGQDADRAAAAALPPEQISERRNAVRQLRGALGKLELVRAESERRRASAATVRPQANPPSLAAVILTLAAGVALAVVGVSLSETGRSVLWGLAGALGAAGAALAAFRFKLNQAFAERAGDPVEAQMTSRQQRATELEQIIGTASALLECGEAELADLDQLEARIEAEQEAMHAARHRKAAAAEAARELAKAQETRRERQARLTSCVHAERACREQWRKRLAALGFSHTDLSPATVSSMLDRIAEVRGWIDDETERRQFISEHQQTIREYENLCRPIPQLRQAVDAGKLASSIDAFLEECQRHRARVDSASVQAERLRARSDETAKRLPLLRAALAESRKAQAEAADTWRQWLAQHNLDARLQPETALEALQSVEECAGLIQGRDELRARLAREEKALSGFKLEASTLLAQLGLPPIDADAELPARITALGEALAAAREDRTRQQSLAEQRNALGVTLAAAEQDVAATQQDVHALLQAVGVADEESFREHAKRHNSRRELDANVQSARATLIKLAHGRPLGELRTELSALSHDEIVERMASIDTDRQALKEKLDAGLRKLGERDREIKNLASADDIARLRFDEESLLAELRDLAERWARHALAAALLEEARRRFERDRQPDVIRDAARYFRTFTGGRYEQVVAAVGEQRIEVVDVDGRRLLPEALSRGTAEQLYLAIRFGYIAQYARHREPLPVIMDDILVNFDPTRAGAAARAIRELAADNQVIFFTCHPATADMLTDGGSFGKLVNLRDGTFD